MSFSTHYPWTKSPLIINAPMAGFANHALATAVTKANGLGFIGSADDMKKLRSEIQAASELLPKTGNSETLPIGVGFILFIADLTAAAEVVREFKPAAVWLFAPKELSDYKIWTEKMREVSPKSKIWIQNGSVASALTLAETCKPDVLVMQGIDAGGHGYEKGASIISLVPETFDALKEKGFNIPIVASGGIVEGRGVAAALTLGAQGVVMGTRFLSAPETTVPAPGYVKTVIEANDGGQNTIRAKVFDEMRGPNIWPQLYDGRSVISKSYTDFKDGVQIEEVRRLFKDAGDGFGAERRATVWAGTGVGLVKASTGAGDIVEEVREGAKRVIEGLKGRI